MKKLLIIFILFFSFFSSSYACAPFFYSEIVIGEYNGKANDIQLPWGDSYYEKVQFINFDNPERLFEGMDLTIGEFVYKFEGQETVLRYPFPEMGKYFYTADDRIDFDVYDKGDILIAISSSSNGDYPEYFGIYETGKLSCKNGEFYIEKKEGLIKTFEKEMWWCGNHKPNDVMSEKELLKKVKEKFGSCENLGIKNTTEKNLLANTNGLEDAKSISENSNTTEIWLLVLLLSIFIVIFLVRLRADN